MNNSSILQWIQNWYKNNCNGDWEHAQNILITTIDNPGWGITIELQGTILESRPFNKLVYDDSVDKWYVCRVENNKFLGDGGPHSLEEMLTIFKNWAEACASQN